MIEQIAKSRIESVLQSDATVLNEADFMAVHVPMKNLLLHQSFSESAKSQGQSVSERDIYRQYILNPENEHRFITVYGVSGTGKSHLIRWLKTEMERNHLENEIIMFIRRSDNTLRGALEQLLQIDEFQNSEDRNILDRLVKARDSITGNHALKSKLYYSLLNLIDLNIHSEDNSLSSSDIRRLLNFLKDEQITNRLIEIEDGPIDRITSKISTDSRFVDRDLVAEFKPEDFNYRNFFPDDNSETKFNVEAGKAANRFYRKLTEDDSGELKNEISKFLNRLIPKMIQETTGIQKGDLREQFHQIRRELKKKNKNLTIFIEDITSFTGVDEELLDVLMEEHTGDYSSAEFCRITSVVGTTTHYLRDNFRDNHKDRISKYIEVKSEQFTEKDRCRLFAQYLNVISLPAELVNQWYLEAEDITDIPVHDDPYKSFWLDQVAINAKETISLFPFTKQSIENLYKSILKESGKRTTRYILTKILKPFVNEYLYNPNQFPSYSLAAEASNTGINTVLNQVLETSLLSEQERQRYSRFLKIWGDSTFKKVTVDKSTYYNGLTAAMIEKFSFPVLDFPAGSASKISQSDSSSEPANSPGKTDQGPVAKSVEDSESNPFRPQEKRKEISNSDFNKASIELERWSQNKQYSIDISSNVGLNHKLFNSLKLLTSLIMMSIDWEAEGFNPFLIDYVVGSKVLFGFEASKRGVLYSLSRSNDNITMLYSLLRLTIVGNNNGSKDIKLNYYEGLQDLQIIEGWIIKNKTQIIENIIQLVDDVPAFEMISLNLNLIGLIIAGEVKDNNFKNIDPLVLLDHSYIIEKLKCVEGTQQHCSTWNNLTTKLIKAIDSNKVKAIDLFDLPQGISKKKIIDYGRYLTVYETFFKEIDQYGSLKYLDINEPRSNVPLDLMKKARTELEEIQKNLEKVVSQEENLEQGAITKLTTLLERPIQDVNPAGIMSAFKALTKSMQSIQALTTKIKPLSDAHTSLFRRKNKVFEGLNKNYSKSQNQNNLYKKAALQSQINLSELNQVFTALSVIKSNLDASERYLAAQQERINDIQSVADHSSSKIKLFHLSSKLDELKSGDE
ncbi:hypothetical protein [Ileibacterium valens]|uniref:hypothetical protein n=1 Tax=Ileibacterium valens TaxID=1862668 RepID=UPI00272D9042|nr:hypothetical protein [Ileibacterium valens]